VWDSKYPLIDQPQQYAHMIFWTEDARIRKIIIKQTVPDEQFWLNQNQLSLLPEDVDIEMWSGEQDADEPVISDSESEDEEVVKKRLGNEMQWYACLLTYC
jgi:hypothetical protein